ncbi:lipopolysaccharide biosynthesis protein [Gillisia hiemivivida]|uniref:Lipopolysaccharide biosynthesis protein n=1 Tax=Gillisia hiemivivida TaxID=291190 RepID=A0A5C6ZR59_9FLAO|nr:lipopolysaccharide biosynthesis protein [Gillisia hiemivivida]TXD92861.1 lipopolysaccharide biosynthesis protein [Gillisia hiemivivida]
MSLRKQATSGLVWTFAEQFGNQLIGFVVSLILARVLLPAEFGLIGMIAILVGLGRVLVDSGLTQSLIRDKNSDQEDYSTVFYFNLVASILVYILIYFIAPLVSDFYSQPILTTIIRLYCLTFVFSAFKSVQMTRLTKQLNFKLQTMITLPSNIVGGITGIYMAYAGYGVYSLVWSQIVISIISTIQVWFYSKWKPSWQFNYTKFKDHFNYGYKLALSGIIDVLFKNSYLIIIGKFFPPQQVGFYTRAETMNQLPVNNISNALKKVTFPLFASIQGDNKRLKRAYRQIMQMVVYLISPVLIFLAVLAEPTFRFLFTEKWLPAVPYFQILCITGILKPIHSYNLNVLKVKGRSDLFLRLSVIEKALIIIGILIGLQFGIYGLLYAQVAVSATTFFMNAHYTDKFIDYSAWEQIKTLIPIIALATVCGALIYLVDYYIYSKLDIVRMLIGGSIGAISYIGLSIIFKMDSYKHFKKLIAKKKVKQ